MSTPATRSSRLWRILAWKSLAWTLLGLALLGRDIVAHELRSTGLWVLLAGTIGLVISAARRSMVEAAGVEPTLFPEEPSERGDGPYRSTPEAKPWALPRRALWIAASALALVLVQALVPLRYYLGDDAYDERFSWRMFSAVRMHSCSLAAFETRAGIEQRVSLRSTIQEAWITTLERNREAVSEQYLEWRCEESGVTAARLENRCRTPEGRDVPPIVRAIDCRTGEIRREGGLE